jgi:hypothetical protein
MPPSTPNLAPDYFALLTDIKVNKYKYKYIYMTSADHVVSDCVINKSA